MRQLRWPGALVAVFAMAIAAGIYLGDGQTGPPHEFAFWMWDVCSGAECNSIYVAHADVALSARLDQNSRALPPGTWKVLSRVERITGVTWSPDGHRLAYLTTNVAGTYPNYDELISYDLWTVNADGSDNRQIDTNVLEPYAGTRITWPRLTWTKDGKIAADHRVVDLSTGEVDGFLILDKIDSPDGKRKAFNVSGIDSGAICVSTGGLDRASRRCFGDGAFGTPVWRPD